MALIDHLLIIGVLVAISAFFSMSEISLAASRKVKLQVLEAEGEPRAARILQLQQEPGHFFTVVQIGLNAVAILGGILGEQALTPYFASWFKLVFGSAVWVDTLGFFTSFAFVTSVFILFADLMPKRLAMIAPESVAIFVVRPMLLCVRLFKPLVWAFNGLANLLFTLFNLPTARDEQITSDEIYAMVDAGAEAGILQAREHHMIGNVFELESRTVPSAMSQRDSIVYFTLQDSDVVIRQKIAEHPHTKFLVCDGHIDNVVGYVESKDILKRVLTNQAFSKVQELSLRTALAVPDSLTLSEMLEQFKGTREDFAVIFNEYALVVGVITLNDVLSTLMGNLVHPFLEDQIVQRDGNSWLIDGATTIEDVCRALDIDSLPEQGSYETIAGFMMTMLKKIPKRTDFVMVGEYKFEVVDIDHYRIDQLLVIRVDTPPADAE
ncbi:MULTISPECIES: hemolysin family protein [unclassified Undibacterium]|uniref:hemolysin family protein n=1 Tax=unclassified Undibacterium TaxID=2630295 RepID=UPI002AC8F6E6|nr:MULTISPECIES: hemolysin family protein [unclassified Undibacterium]MEB0137794.1 hemolysin family protein [Undibacterium sp. CCC2.1]MEB0171015.1 hemolysin family protein [Undibacterium sp. CCC1.1]MEB0175060.1 hemolysin family protein [Undibacterium sp. CCC3.4]MEB0215162.1 hemolysin family protein [Undibacterium sp. 5I2]WPX44864.1 hemolysin family protein [Undibacterium sp. CCC3.4]